MGIRSIGFAALAAGLTTASLSAPPEPPPATVEIIYTPAVAIVPEVRTPANELRTYRTSEGASYWSRHLPVFRGDRMRLNVFVSTGGADLAETRVRVDNVEVDRRTAAPWTSTVETGSLSEGFHFVEAWARTGGLQPRAATDTLVFFVDPRPGEQATTASPIVGPIPPPPTAPPPVEPGAGGPTVSLTTDDAEARRGIAAGVPVTVDRPVEFAVSGPKAGETFVYALFRDGKQIHRSQPMPAETRVKLRPNAPNQPGLMPGLVWLAVWGADKTGRLGAPRLLAVRIPFPEPSKP